MLKGGTGRMMLRLELQEKRPRMPARSFMEEEDEIR